jgi:low affinity Fe/Cu permease
MKKKKPHEPSGFERMSAQVTRASGSTTAFITALAVIVVWGITGPIFRYSDTWQLVINTGTTIVTFLMVFLIQRTQNKDSIAIHLKLNELVIAHELANNRLVSIKSISEKDLEVLQKYYKHLAELASKELSVEESHSIEVAKMQHERKRTIKTKNNRSNT